MAAYKIYFRKSVLKDLEKIPKIDLKRIISRIEALADDPRPPGVEKFFGLDRYRIRQGNYRTIYSIQDNELTIWVVKIGARRLLESIKEFEEGRGTEAD